MSTATKSGKTPEKKKNGKKEEIIIDDKGPNVSAVINSVVRNPAHRAILEAVRQCGVYPPPMPSSAVPCPVSVLPSWEEFRSEVLVPAVDELLLISFENRSEVLPNGKMADGSIVGSDTVDSVEVKMAKDSNGGHLSPPTGNHNNGDCNTNGGLGNIDTGVLPVVFSEKEFIAENDAILFELMNCPYPILNIQRLSEVLLDHTKYHTHTSDNGVIARRALEGTDDGPTPVVVSSSSDEVIGSPPHMVSSAGTTVIRIRGEKLQAALRKIIMVSSIS